MGEVVVGVDAHKRSHTLVAVDVVGRKLGERTEPLYLQSSAGIGATSARPRQRVVSGRSGG